MMARSLLWTVRALVGEEAIDRVRPATPLGCAIIVAMTAGPRQPAFVMRFQLTTADMRRAFWSTIGEWVPWLIGVALLAVVCATWRPLGPSGRLGAIVFPLAMVLWMLARLNQTTRVIEPYLGKDFVLSVDEAGLRLDFALAKTEMPWTTVTAIERHRAFWFFRRRGGGRFVVPAAAIPVEARAYIGRWAGQARARLT
jgi:hypothetical protein